MIKNFYSSLFFWVSEANNRGSKKRERRRRNAFDVLKYTAHLTSQIQFHLIYAKIIYGGRIP